MSSDLKRIVNDNQTNVVDKIMMSERMLNNKAEKINKENQDLKIELNKYQKEELDLKAKILEIESHDKSVSSELQTLTIQNNTLEERIQQLTYQTDHQENQKRELKLSLQSLIGVIKKQTAQQDKIRGQICQIDDKLQQINTAYHAKAPYYEELAHKENDIKERIEKRKNDIEGIKTDIHEIDLKIEKTCEAKANPNLLESLLNQYKAEKEENDNLMHDYRARIRELKEMKQQIQQGIADEDQKIKALKKNLKLLSLKDKELKEKYDSVKSETEVNTETYDSEFESIIQKMNEEHEQKKSEKDEKVNAEIEEINKNIEAKQHEIETIKSQTIDKISAIKEAEARLEQIKRDMETENQSFNESRENMMTDIQDKMNKLRMLYEKYHPSPAPEQ